MKTWRVVLIITDDGVSDTGIDDYLSVENLKSEIETNASFVSGIEAKVESIIEVKSLDDKH